MITQRTKIQLIVFLVLTLLGVSFVGARYARLDRMVLDTSYEVVAHYDDSGGIFTGAEVTYRGVQIGRVSKMELTDEGVDVFLAIENDFDDIPADTRALVGNRSAVGEQFVELQPQSDGEPFLEGGSEIDTSMTEVPITTTEWLSNTQDLVNSVPKKDLDTVITEFGAAFEGGGDDLSRLIDSSSSFIDAANENFELTTTLVNESRIVLGTQLDKASAIRSFMRDLRLFSDTMADADGSLRKVIDDGSVTASTLRAFLEENEADLGKLFSDLATIGEIQVKHLAGTRMILILYPYVVAGGYAVASPDANGQVDAHFGLILTEEPVVCERGYNARIRDPQTERGNAPMDEDARCAEPMPITPRGAHHAPGRAPMLAAQPGVDAPVVGSFDRESGEFSWKKPEARVGYTGGASQYGDHSWKWLLMQPVMR